MPDEKMGGAAKKIPVLLTPQLLLFCSPRDSRLGCAGAALDSLFHTGSSVRHARSIYAAEAVPHLGRSSSAAPSWIESFGGVNAVVLS
jgi:hypothetical protein